MIPRADIHTPFAAWVGLFRAAAPGTVSIPLWRGEGWRDWADAFEQAADGDVLDVPRQTEFPSFESWADEFIRRNEG